MSTDRACLLNAHWLEISNETKRNETRIKCPASSRCQSLTETLIVIALKSTTVQLVSVRFFPFFAVGTPNIVENVQDSGAAVKNIPQPCDGIYPCVEFLSAGESVELE